MISTTTNSISYSGNNSTTTAYPIPFPFLDREHFRVVETDSEGVETLLTYGTDYTVSSLTDGNGRITSGTLKTIVAVPVASSLSIKRVTPALQETDLVDGGRLSAEVLESALDRVTMVAQEAVRDVTNDGETNVEAEGTGLVAQTASGVFSTRTIAPASGSPLTITNGGGVAGNPTIELDLSLLDAETVAADDDQIPALIGGDLVLIDVSDLLDRTQYREIHFNALDCQVGGGATGISISDFEDGGTPEAAVNFTSTATGTANLHFFVPTDYTGGEIKLKFRNWLVTGTNGEQWVWTLSVYDQALTPVLVADAGGTYAQTHSETDTRSTAMSIGADLEAGKFYQLFIEREVTDALDTTSKVARLTDLVLQYAAKPKLTGW
jgi:hypothetical protein